MPTYKTYVKIRISSNNNSKSETSLSGSEGAVAEMTGVISK